MRRRFPHVLAPVLLLAALSTASFSKSPATTLPSLHYLQPDSVDFKSILPPVPANDSDLAHIDIAELLVLQKNRTDDDTQRIDSEARNSPRLITQTLPWLSEQDTPKTMALLQPSTRTPTRSSVRPRIFTSASVPRWWTPRIKPAIKVPRESSYPSGHSTDCTVDALVLADLLPDQRDLILAHAYQIGEDRELAGVHFPTDIQAGRLLAQAIVKSMRQNPDFQTDFAKAQAECKALEPAAH